MKATYCYTITQEPDGYFLVEFPDIEEAFSEADSIDAAMLNAKEVLELSLIGRIEDGREIPEQQYSGQYVAIPDLNIQLAVIMHRLLAENTASISGLARDMKTSWAAAQKLTKIDNNPTLKTIQDAALAFGMELKLELV